MPESRRPVPAFVIVGAFIAAATLAIALGHGTVRAAGAAGLVLSIMPAVDGSLARWIRVVMIGIASLAALLFLPGTGRLGVCAFVVGLVLQAAMVVAEARLRRLRSRPDPAVALRRLDAFHNRTHQPWWAERSSSVKRP